MQFIELLVCFWQKVLLSWYRVNRLRIVMDNMWAKFSIRNTHFDLYCRNVDLFCEIFQLVDVLTNLKNIWSGMSLWIKNLQILPENKKNLSSRVHEKGSFIHILKFFALSKKNLTSSEGFITLSGQLWRVNASFSPWMLIFIKVWNFSRGHF